MANDMVRSLSRRPLLLLALQCILTGTGLLAAAPTVTAVLFVLSAVIFLIAPAKMMHAAVILLLILSFALRGHFVQAPLPQQLRLEIVEGAPVTADAKDYTYAVAVLPDGRRLVVYGRSNQLKAGYAMTVKGPASAGQQARNPGGFNEARWVLSLGAVGTVRLRASDSPVPAGSAMARLRFGLWSARRHIFGTVSDALPESLAGWVTAFSGGSGRALDDLQAGRLSQLSLSHLTSVSGMHVGFLLAPLAAKRMRRAARNRRLLLQTVLMIWIYFLAGGRSGVTRAVMMRQIGMAAGVSGRYIGALETVSGAVLLMLIAFPYRLLQTGFWLSILAAAAIHLLAGPFRQYLHSVLPWLPNRLVGALAVTTVAQAAVLPLLMAKNEVVTPISIVLNVAVSFAAQSMTVLALLTVTCLPLLALLGIAPIFAWIIEPPLSLLTAIFEAVVNVTVHPGRLWLPGYVSIFAFLLFALFAGYSAARVNQWRIRHQRVGPLVLTVLLVVVLTFAAPALRRITAPPLTVWFLDVGQGDAAVIHFRNGTTWLLDGGERSHGYKTIWPFMKAQGISEIDLAIVSHGHSDHAGGVLDLLELGKIRQIALSGLEGRADKEEPADPSPYKEADLSQELLNAAENHCVPVLQLMPGDIVQENQAVMTVLPVFPEGDDPNDRSLQLSLAFSHVTMLFTGDATPEVEAAMLALELQPVTVLKVAHHGSRFTTGLPFVRAVRPELSVISVGFNTYGHPSPDVLSNLAAVGSQVCRTDHAGAIRLRTDGRKVDADTWLRQHTTSP